MAYIMLLKVEPARVLFFLVGVIALVYNCNITCYNDDDYINEVDYERNWKKTAESKKKNGSLV